MGHQRLVKEGYFTDYDVCQMQPLYRLFFEALWCQADRNGVIEYKPQQLKARCMPYDDVDPVAAIAEMVERGFLFHYRVAGREYLQVRTWKKNQPVHHGEKGSELPLHEAEGAELVERHKHPSQETVSKRLADGELTPPPNPNPFPNPVPSPSPNPSPVPGPIVAGTVAPATRRSRRLKVEKLPDPRHAPLRDRLVAIYLEARGRPYGFKPRDAKAISSLLEKGTDEEIEAMWRRGLAAPPGYRCTDNIHELDEKWNSDIGATGRARNGHEVRRGYSDAQDQDWSGDGGYGEANKKAVAK